MESAVSIHHTFVAARIRLRAGYNAAQEERFPLIGPRVPGAGNPDRLHAGAVS